MGLDGDSDEENGKHNNKILKLTRPALFNTQNNLFEINTKEICTQPGPHLYMSHEQTIGLKNGMHVLLTISVNEKL